MVSKVHSQRPSTERPACQCPEIHKVNAIGTKLRAQIIHCKEQHILLLTSSWLRSTDGAISVTNKVSKALCRSTVLVAFSSLLNACKQLAKAFNEYET